MSKKSKKCKSAVVNQEGISKRLQEHTAEIEYVLRCCFVPIENRTPEGIARLAEAINRDRIV